MPAREESIPNQLTDVIVDLLKGISRASDATRWLTTPRVVKRGALVGDIASGMRPALFVRIGRLSDEQQAGGRHNAKFTVFVHCISEATIQGDAERETWNMIADVFRALSDDETLRGHAALRTVSALTAEAEVEATERLGVGVATVTMDVDYHWGHGSP